MNGSKATQLILLAGVLLLKTWARDAVRLVEGPTAREGRVEVFHSGAWGVVCGEQWDLVDATVVCRLLGYDGALTHVQNSSLEQNNNTLWLSNVQCAGNESSLFQCSHAGWEKNTCNEGQAAGVTCSERGWGISLATPQFVSSTLNTITIKCSVPDLTEITYTVQMWTNTTEQWRDTRCRQNRMNESCFVRTPKAIITVTDLAPEHVYFFRLASPYQVYSQVSEPVATKELGHPSAPRFVSSSDRSITLVWGSATSESTNYSVEVKCYGEKTWTEATCIEDVIGRGCTVRSTTATVTGLKKYQDYHFRVLAIYKNWKSKPSLSSEAMRIKSRDIPSKIWIGSIARKCVASQIGDRIILFCRLSNDKPTYYKWTKGQRIINSSGDGVLNVTISSLADFGVYTCHVITSDDVTQYNISVCKRVVLEETVTQDSLNETVIAIITTSFICFGTFIIVLILLKMVQIYQRRKKQSKEIEREEMAMLQTPYRQKPTRNNNEEEFDLNT